MAVAVVALLSFGGLPWLLRVSLFLGVLANLEGLAMSLLLPRWKNDVNTLGACWRLRREMLGGGIE